MLYTYGVRGGQVRSLRLQEIDWAQDQIFFRAAKHGKDIRLPLTPEVGESLLDYLRNARPACSCPEVFLTCRAPYHRLPNSNSLSALVERRIRAAGIDLVSSGSHAFRHGFATTHIYLEIDMEMKRQMLQKAEAPTVNSATPWRKPGILEWLTRLAKAPQLCAAHQPANKQNHVPTAEE